MDQVSTSMRKCTVETERTDFNRTVPQIPTRHFRARVKQQQLSLKPCESNSRANESQLPELLRLIIQLPSPDKSLCV